MKRLGVFCFAAALLGTGCATTGPSLSDAVATEPGCRVGRAVGDVAAVLRESGELAIAGGGIVLLRSEDRGRSFTRERLPVHCRWPGLAETGGRLVVSCSEPAPPGRLLVLIEEADGRWPEPVVVDATDELFIDSNLQSLGGGKLLLFATYIDRRGDLDDSVYEIRVYSSSDGGSTWSGPTVVESGRRGVHLEDTRSVDLGGGEVLVAYELETAEGRPSQVVLQRSVDGGATWSSPEAVWDDGDLEPGGFVLFEGGRLWFLASTDSAAGGGSYDRATIWKRRSRDGGRSWSKAEMVVPQEDQLSFGGVALPDGAVLLPSLRFYSDPERRQLWLYAVDESGVHCAAEQ